MKIYSKLKINLVSMIVTIIIYFFCTTYFSQIYKVAYAYFYYKSQPNLTREYEE